MRVSYYKDILEEKIQTSFIYEGRKIIVVLDFSFSDSGIINFGNKKGEISAMNWKDPFGASKRIKEAVFLLISENKVSKFSFIADKKRTRIYLSLLKRMGFEIDSIISDEEGSFVSFTR